MGSEAGKGCEVIEVSNDDLIGIVAHAIDVGRRQGYISCIDWIMDKYHDDVKPEVVVDLWLKKRELDETADNGRVHRRDDGEETE